MPGPKDCAVSPDDRTVRLWGIGIGLAAFLDVLRITVRFALLSADAHLATGPAAVLVDHPSLVAALALGFVVAWGLYLRSGRGIYGALAFALLFIIVRARLAILDTGHQDFMQSGAAMLGWLAGHAYAHALGIQRAQGEQHRRECMRYAATAAVAAFAASYVCAGSSKILNSGGDWLGSETVRLMIASHTPVGTDAAVNLSRDWMLHTPWVTTALEFATLATQLGAVFLLAGPLLRAVAGLALFGFHVGTWMSADIVFVAPMVLALWLAIPWSRGHPRIDVKLDSISAPRTMRTIAICIAVWMTLIWGTPMGHMLRFEQQPFHSNEPW